MKFKRMFYQYKFALGSFFISVCAIWAFDSFIKEVPSPTIATIIGFVLTLATFKRNNDLTIDKMMRDESTTLLQDKDAFELMYFLDIEGDAEKCLDENIQKYMQTFIDNEKSYDRFLLYMNRIAFLDEQEHGFNASYFQFYFDTLARSQLIRWYLSYGTFENKEVKNTGSFEKLYSNLKEYMATKGTVPVNWSVESERHNQDFLYLKLTETHRQLKGKNKAKLKRVSNL